ncbi:hypothetical protein BJF83_23440 [Nocardiopsis sp. CNR-923]|nr:hypothetical protein BJF83_23440 [Nocardiopsis sp. CNR-923]
MLREDPSLAEAMSPELAEEFRALDPNSPWEASAVRQPEMAMSGGGSETSNTNPEASTEGGGRGGGGDDGAFGSGGGGDGDDDGDDGLNGDSDDIQGEPQDRGDGDAETDPDVLNSRPGDGYYLASGEFVDVGHRDISGSYIDELGNRFIDVPQSTEAADIYRRVAESPESTHDVHRNTGYDLGILNQIREHLFQREHVEVPGPPIGEVRDGRFAPVDHVALYWELAESGDINLRENRSEAEAFRRLMVHEYVESRLMEAGVPYRAHGSELWDDGVYFPSPEQHGAHDISPHEHLEDSFRVWRRYGITEPDFEIAADLSNLDDVVDIVMKFKGLK